MKTTYVLASVFAAVSGLAGLATPARAGTDFHLNIGIGSRPGPVIVAPRGARVLQRVSTDGEAAAARRPTNGAPHAELWGDA